MKVLLIGKEDRWLVKFSIFLQKNRVITERVTGLRKAYQRLNNYEYDCVLVETDQSEAKSIAFIDQARKDNPQTGIILIGNSIEVNDLIEQLEAGADDVIRQPVTQGEVYARMKAVLRRYPQGETREIAIDGLTVKLDEYAVLTDGIPLELTKKEFEILTYLARNRNRIVSKDSLAEYLWGDYSDSADSYDFLYAHIKNLRKKLAERGYSSYIKTIYGIGYRLEG